MIIFYHKIISCHSEKTLHMYYEVAIKTSLMQIWQFKL